MQGRATVKLRIKLVALGFLAFGVTMFAWAALLILGVSIEETREKLLAGAPLYLIIPGIIFLAACALCTAVGLLLRAEWSRPVSTLLCLSSLLFVPVGTVFGVFGLWALSTSQPPTSEKPTAES